jgi:hypothetical protein
MVEIGKSALEIALLGVGWLCQDHGIQFVGVNSREMPFDLHKAASFSICV